MRKISAFIIVTGALAAVGGLSIAANDKNTVRVPDGLGFADFEGYESWEVVSVAAVDATEPAMAGDSDAVLNVIMANPTMIEAYKKGVPANGTKFPDGSKIVKVQWKTKKDVDSPFSVNVPDALRNVAFIEKDSKRFQASGGWGYANFNYDGASDSFAPDGQGTDCGHACHTVVESKDYIFHSYQKR
ncbi:cytochrome P460 family protein [Rhizobiaceae bacterium n13]|uniref:cytochrome P460 family protein n=1 Tax=Ferirhizobium litorale TaxID=2927786 RepID=UPI0024B2EBC4|nr:cytochrome P460 family protein [Fererhizobium litorale]MDI7865199.1 cytochrome P460 family protein [Fererhizobium litorale]